MRPARTRGKREGASPDAESADAPTREEAESRSAGAARLKHLVGVLRIVVGTLLFVLVVAAIVQNWNDVEQTLLDIGPLQLGAAEMLVLAGLSASALTWRVAIFELGSAVPLAAALKIYLVGQLAKYVPGSVWAPAAQMELAACDRPRHPSERRVRGCLAYGSRPRIRGDRRRCAQPSGALSRTRARSSDR